MSADARGTEARRRLTWRCRTCGRTRAELDLLVVQGREVPCAECWDEAAGVGVDAGRR